MPDHRYQRTGHEDPAQGTSQRRHQAGGADGGRDRLPRRAGAGGVEVGVVVEVAVGGKSVGVCSVTSFVERVAVTCAGEHELAVKARMIDKIRIGMNFNFMVAVPFIDGWFRYDGGGGRSC